MKEELLMRWILGNYTDEPIGRVILTYGVEPPQNTINTYDFVFQVEEVPEKVTLAGKSTLLYANSTTQEVWWEEFDRELTPEEQIEKQIGIIAQISTRDKVKADQLSESDLLTLAGLYPHWETGKEYVIGDVISYHGGLYEIIQSHTSQADWTPDTAASLFVNKMPEGVIPEWQQPAGAHDAYDTGDIVLHNDQQWVSDIDANTWEPGVHGWSVNEG